MSTTAYASNGDRDGLKTGMYWAISSQATQEWAEGSTTSAYRPDRTKGRHECGAYLPVSLLGRILGFLTKEISLMADKKFFVTEEELRKAYDDLGSALEVANHYGVSKKLVLTYMKRFGVAKHPRHMITEEIGAQIVQLAGEGCTSQQIADEIGFSLVAVNGYARKNGLTIVDPKHPGVITTWAGYRKLAMPDHPRADSKGYVLEHTLVMEAHIGRFLAPHEVVHHRDGVKGNNTLNNLELMTDTEHRRLHATRGDSGWVKHWATAA